MPINPADPPPEPTDPVERGLIGLLGARRPQQAAETAANEGEPVSVLSRVFTPAATHDLAGMVVALFSAATGHDARPCLPGGPTGSGTSAVRVSAGQSAGGGSGSELSCSPALRDDALGRGADAKVIGSRLGITYAAVDPADLPVSNTPQPDQDLSDEPVAVAYRLTSFEFADRRVRRVFALAGTASVILNDLHSMAEESDTDFDLPKVIAAEEKRSPPDLWAWPGGNRGCHSTTKRYHGASNA